MKQAPIWVMRIVIVLEGLWFALVSFLFNFKLPLGMIFVLGTWVMLIAALFLFTSQKRNAALTLSYIAVMFGVILLSFGGGGPPHFFSSLYRNAPSIVFLIAAHYAYQESALRS